MIEKIIDPAEIPKEKFSTMVLPEFLKKKYFDHEKCNNCGGDLSVEFEEPKDGKIKMIGFCEDCSIDEPFIPEFLKRRKLRDQIKVGEK